MCGADGDCTDSLLCQFRQDGGQERVCTQVGIGAIGSVCRRDTECNNINDGICIGDTGRQVCAQMGNGEADTVCSADNHCNPGHICHDYVCTVDSTIWVSKESNVDGELRDVHYANGLWVAVGGTADSGETTDSGEPIGRGDITTSAYGTVWRSEISRAEDPINAVHYGGDLWVSVSAGGNVARRGINNGNVIWRGANHAHTSLNDLHYARFRWVIVGEHFNRHALTVPGTGYIVPGGSASSFTESTAGGTLTHGLNAVHYDNSRWVAVGAGGLIVTGTDGTIWASEGSVANRGTLVDVYYGNSLWVAASDNGNIITGTNGTTWTGQSIADSEIEITDIHYANGLWVAVGTDIDSNNDSNNGLVVTSPDGTTWTKRTSNATSTLNAVHYDNTLWVAVGNGGVVVTSTNGTTWAATEKQCNQ